MSMVDLVERQKGMSGSVRAKRAAWTASVPALLAAVVSDCPREAPLSASWPM